MKKMIIVLSAVLAISVLMTGCAKSKPQPSAVPTAVATQATKEMEQSVNPTATPNAKITHTEGRVLETKEPAVEGQILHLAQDKMDIRVAGETYSFVLGEKAKRDLSLFNKNPEQPRIMEGTFVIVYYEENGKDKVANSIEILESN